MSVQTSSSIVSDSPFPLGTNNVTDSPSKNSANSSSPKSVSSNNNNNNNNSNNNNISTVLKNQYTTEIVKSLFGSRVGTIHYHCTCHHPSRHLSGKLYIGTHALAFYSNLFGIERKALLDYDNISAAQEYRTTSIIVFHKEHEYKFRALPERSEVLITLKQLIYNATSRDCVMLALVDSTTKDDVADLPPHYNNNKRNSKQECNTRNRFRPKAVISKVSQDHQPSSLRRSRINSVDVSPPSSSIIKPSLGQRQRSSSTGTLRKHLTGKPSFYEPNNSTISRVDSSDSDFGDNSSLAGEVLGLFGFSSVGHDDDEYEGDVEVKYDGNNHNTILLPNPAHHNMPLLEEMYFTNKSILDSFHSMKIETEESWKEILFHDICISDGGCTLEKYFDKFIADDASHSIGHYQERVIGDTEVQTTPWAKTKNMDDKGYLKQERFITFRHKVTAPVGPSSTRATKHQTCFVFGTSGLIIETRTTLKDVPNSNCFHVEDRIIVEQHDDGAIKVTVTFQVQFVKNTMWKKIIEKMTRTEVDAWFRGYVHMLVRAMDGAPVSMDSTTSTSNCIDFASIPTFDTTITAAAVLAAPDFTATGITQRHRPMNTTFEIVESNAECKTIINIATAEIKKWLQGNHMLELIIVCLFAAKLVFDIGSMKDSLASMHYDLTQMQIMHSKEVESIYEAITSLKNQLVK